MIAGSVEHDGAIVTPPPPPPHSWASRSDADLAIWHVRLEPEGSWMLPATARDDTVRVLYVFEGDGLVVDGDERVEGSMGAVVRSDSPVSIAHPGTGGTVEVLVLQARPIGEPVAQQGPFVMTTQAEIRQAFEDYQRTQFGGWPWATSDPVHGADATRFARHADGRHEEAPEPRQPATV